MVSNSLLSLNNTLLPSQHEIILDGSNLDIAKVVNCARVRTRVAITSDKSILKDVDDCVDFLASKAGHSIYGVTTGFGGSADTRTPDVNNLQRALLEHQLCGFLPLNAEDVLSKCMPEEIVRGAMCIRVNSLLRGHSAIRLQVLQTVVNFLNLGITPLVPLRGSISASGDLSPLSYVAAAICGHPDVRVIDRSSGSPVVMSSTEALAKHDMPPVVLAAKEGLALVNGTAYSASAASLAAYDTHFLTLLTQALTAMTVEAMNGEVGSFHPFIHDVCRPHEGQVEVAANIRNMLQESVLAISHMPETSIEADAGILRQDRYPLRTSAQFLGPQLENLELATKQIHVELNSTTDNPLIDFKGKEIHHGGNFQAISITNAMEASRLSIQLLGKLSFSQFTEMINCSMNRGLPSCLAGSEPSTNYMCKGLDIHAAAYTAELGYLASPQSTHIQSAEMHNQAVNSMALASARRNIEANEVLTLLLSTHLYAACQAVDLRSVDLEFRAQLRDEMLALAEQHLSPLAIEASIVKAHGETAVATLMRRLDQTSSMDSKPRFQDAFDFASAAFMSSLTASSANPLPALNAWKLACSTRAVEIWNEWRQKLFSGEVSASPRLGKGTRKLYEFVRNDLGIKARKGDVAVGHFTESIGSAVSKIVEGLQTEDGRRAVLLATGKMDKVMTNGKH